MKILYQEICNHLLQVGFLVSNLVQGLQSDDITLPLTILHRNNPQTHKTNKDKSEIKLSISTTQQVPLTTNAHLELLDGVIISRLISDQGAVKDIGKDDINNTNLIQREMQADSSHGTEHSEQNQNNKSSVSNAMKKQIVISNSTTGIDQSSSSDLSQNGEKTKTLNQNGGTVYFQSTRVTNGTTEGQRTRGTLISTTAWNTQSSSFVTTKRPIYFRGHKLHKSPPGTKRKANPLFSDYEHINSPSAMIAKHGYPPHHVKRSCWPNCDIDESNTDEGSGELKGDSKDISMRTKTQSNKQQLNFKRTGNIQVSNNDKPGTRVYGWILGAAMLTVGSLVSLTGGVLLCYCGEKWKKRREERRRLEKYGEYERVESVSSLVSSAAAVDISEDQLESVSMI